MYQRGDLQIMLEPTLIANPDPDNPGIHAEAIVRVAVNKQTYRVSVVGKAGDGDSLMTRIEPLSTTGLIDAIEQKKTVVQSMQAQGWVKASELSNETLSAVRRVYDAGRRLHQMRQRRAGDQSRLAGRRRVNWRTRCAGGRVGGLDTPAAAPPPTAQKLRLTCPVRLRTINSPPRPARPPRRWNPPWRRPCWLAIRN